MMGFVNQVPPVLVEDTCRDYSQINGTSDESSLSLCRLVNIVSNVDGKAYRLTCILILLIVFSSVYIEAMTFVFNHQKQAKMKSKNLMKPTAEEM